MSVQWRPLSRAYVYVFSALLCISSPESAYSQSFLGLFGSDQPKIVANALSYKLTIRGIDADADATAAVNDVAVLYRLRAEPPENADELLRRVETDLPRIVDAMWGAGYYAVQVAIVVGGQTLTLGQQAPQALKFRLDRLRGRQIVPVDIVITPGPLYSYSRLAIIDQRSGRLFDPAVLPDRIVTLKAGDPARTAGLLAAAAQISDYFRDRGHPFVKVVQRRPVIDHRTQTVDVELAVDPGPVAGIGGIGIAGTREVDPRVVRSFIYAERGDPYSPKVTSDIRKSVSRIEAIGAVRVREGTALDQDGNLPLDVEVTERPLRVLGASARYSTVDGPALRGYWAHRNLFGGAERLRLEADLFYLLAKQAWPGGSNGGGFTPNNLGGRVAASFIKPALGGSRNDLLIDAAFLRERTEYYSSNVGAATVAVRHRFSDTFSIQGGVEGQVGQSIDPLGRNNFGLVGLPMSVTYDSTDRPLDPSRGIRVIASFTPYHGFRDAPSLFGVGRIQASGYYSLDEAARYILAARIAFGSIAGGTIAQIPASMRFYAGGGGSVRGYEYKSLGPRDANGFVIGGKSLLEASFEARIKLTDTIGIVPFVDIGQAFASSFPDGTEQLRIGAGLGLRYYTAIGPIRLDFAVPIARRTGERAYAVYVSLGQAF
jgi:translocation and assembly module TamA